MRQDLMQSNWHLWLTKKNNPAFVTISVYVTLMMNGNNSEYPRSIKSIADAAVFELQRNQSQHVYLRTYNYKQHKKW